MIARGYERWLWIAAVELTSLSGARTAEAHAPPAASDVQWFAGRALVRTNRGLIVEDANVRSFRLVCNDAFHASLVEVPPLATTSDGRILLGTYEAGFLLSSADACSFEPVPGALSGLNAVDVAQDSQGRLRALVLPLDGSPAGLFESRDEGQTFASVTTFSVVPTALEVAPSDPARVYVSALAFDANTTFARLLRSTDAGRTFTDLPLELDASELRAFVEKVDPVAPDRVFVRTLSRDGLTPERLLRSDDGGQSFQTVLQEPGPLSVAVAPDGAVWAGSAVGLSRSTDGARTFTALTSLELSRVTCLSLHAGRLYACGFHAGEFGVVMSSDQGASIEWFLRFPDVQARADCATGSDEALYCAAAFRDWSLEQRPAQGSGGTASGAGGGGDKPGGAVAEPGCALSRVGPSTGTSPLILLGMLAALLRARRAPGGVAAPRSRAFSPARGY
jgi:hypothetical protein